MKPNLFYLILLCVILHFSYTLQSQTAIITRGCDLCGPSTGTNKNIALGSYSATIGAGCETRGSYSFSTGFCAKGYASNTIALGRFVMVKATNSMVIGSGTGNSESQMLKNEIPNSLMIGFNSVNPTLFVSNSTGFNTTGKIGIGNITSPKSKLHIKSDNNEDAGMILEPTNISNSAYIQLHNENNVIKAEKETGMSLTSQNNDINLIAKNVVMNAKVAINTTTSFAKGYDYALAVSGGILTTKVLVKEVTEWYDDVFDDGYDLISISELERFIEDNGHLPDIPSETHVLDKGYDMVEMDGLLLKKIEELSLYAIELNKQLKRQQEIIESLQNK